MKWALFIVSVHLISSVNSQHILTENRYGDKLFFIDDHALHKESRFGEKLVFWDGRTIQEENRYAGSLFYRREYGKN